MKVVKNIVYYFLGNLLPKLSSLILLPIYTFYLGPTEYGIVETMAVAISILIVLFSLGFNNSVYRLYYDYGSEVDRSTLFGTINMSTFFWAIIFSIGLILFNSPISQVFNSIPFFPYFFISILISLISNIGDLPKAHLMLRQKALNYSIVGFCQFLITAIITLWFVVIKKEGAIGMLKGQLFGGILMLPYFISYSIRNFTFKFNRSIFSNVIVFSLPTIPTLISAWILNMSDRVFIEKYLSIGDVGIYSLGYKIAGVIGFVFTAVDMTYMPYFFKLANTSSKISLSKIAIINHTYNIILLLITFSIALFSKEIVELFFTKKFVDAYKVIMIVSYVYYFIQYGTIFSKNLSQSKKVTQGMYIDIGCAILNIGLNFILIPYFGMFGAAWATLISFIASTAVYFYYSSRYTFYVPINLKFTVLSLLGSLFLLVLLNEYLSYNWIVLFLLKSLLILIILIFVYFYYSKHQRILRLLFFNRKE